MYVYVSFVLDKTLILNGQGICHQITSSVGSALKFLKSPTKFTEVRGGLICFSTGARNSVPKETSIQSKGGLH